MALIIRRFKGQKVYIGNEVAVTIMGVQNQEVILSFEGDPNIKIDRHEVRMKKLREMKKIKARLIKFEEYAFE